MCDCLDGSSVCSDPANSVCTFLPCLWLALLLLSQQKIPGMLGHPVWCLAKRTASLLLKENNYQPEKGRGPPSCTYPHVGADLLATQQRLSFGNFFR